MSYLRNLCLCIVVSTHIVLCLSPSCGPCFAGLSGLSIYDFL